ncbi:MAG TPA: molybdate ABC transporter substrate-binding protein [Bryobacteraceae bacterium]|nr:molybdate ABC transporter substrate-binding protein [Bryobacteraceae bacterium]
MKLSRAIVGTCALAAVIAIAAFSPARDSKSEVAIAAAANLSEVLQVIGPRFEAATGIHPVFSFASTAQLALQIEHSAPFDVFAAADVEHVEQLEKKGLLTPGSKAVYATGILALWIPPAAKAKIDKVSDVTQPPVRVIALAKPELAPYGLAARESLQRLGIWDQVQPRIVYADNINMAKQYGASGNADAVFTAYSLVMKEGGKVISVDEQLHRPIDQALGIVAASKQPDAARRFADFLLKGAGRDILGSSGYQVPPR